MNMSIIVNYHILIIWDIITSNCIVNYKCFNKFSTLYDMNCHVRYFVREEFAILLVHLALQFRQGEQIAIQFSQAIPEILTLHHVHAPKIVHLKILNCMEYKGFSIVSKCTIQHTIILLLKYYKTMKSFKLCTCK